MSKFVPLLSLFRAPGGSSAGANEAVVVKICGCCDRMHAEFMDTAAFAMETRMRMVALGAAREDAVEET